MPRRLTLALLLSSSLIACRSKQDTQASRTVEAWSVATATAASGAPTTASPTANPVAEETPAALDAGTTSERRRHHRSASAASSSAPVASNAEPPAPAPVAASATTELQKRTPPKAMGNDGVYGGTPDAAAAPMLKKTPLEDKDPWAKPNP